jgi:hypothetical protein
MLVRQRTQLLLERRKQNALHDSLELNQKTGNGKLHRAGMPSFGVGLGNPILKLAIPASKSLRPLNFARGSELTASIAASGQDYLQLRLHSIRQDSIPFRQDRIKCN